MVSAQATGPTIKEPHGLSPRIRRLRDFYFEGVRRPWNDELTCWTTGTPWDVVYDETNYHIVPETYPFLRPFTASALQAARPVDLDPDFWTWSLPERRTWLIRKVLVDCVPQEILPGDLVAGVRFNVLVSRCWTAAEARRRERALAGRHGMRAALKAFHEHGCGNAGATPWHLIPDYRRVLSVGWQGIHDDLAARHGALAPAEQRGPKGAQRRAMMTAATMAPGPLLDLARRSDLVLYDLKEIHSERHACFTGQPNDKILANVRAVADLLRAEGSPPELCIRTPLIPGTTVTEEKLTGIGRFIATHLADVVTRWELCAFNPLATDKYERLGLRWAFAGVPPMTGAELQHAEAVARHSGVDPQIVVATGMTRLASPTDANAADGDRARPGAGT